MRKKKISNNKKCGKICCKSVVSLVIPLWSNEISNYTVRGKFAKVCEYLLL